MFGVSDKFKDGCWETGEFFGGLTMYVTGGEFDDRGDSAVIGLQPKYLLIVQGLYKVPAYIACRRACRSSAIVLLSSEV
jgi:hypothetical protein